MSQYRVVIVDDDFAVARINAQFVEAHGAFTVLAEAHDATSALETITRLQPDLVLLDVYLPDYSGITLLQQIRASGARAEVIAVTAARDLDTVHRARLLGVRHYLVKPFKRADLSERLDEFVQSRALGPRSPESGLDQGSVDAVLGSPSSTPRRRPVPKGLATVTLDRVASALASQDEPVSAALLAETLGMSRVSARRYLEFLVQDGRAEVAPKYGVAGRPENLYSARQ
ncbi:response regulator [Humidisolicoccus flavus]|uniref:response regulator n=1 Tax=Humidisolicoccus flavus TaxID=3111414 RepID=UPI00324FD625